MAWNFLLVLAIAILEENDSQRYISAQKKSNRNVGRRWLVHSAVKDGQDIKPMVCDQMWC